MPKTLHPKTKPVLKGMETAVLNRLTYGSTPEAIEEVKKAGIRSYIEQQLNPNPDSTKDEKVAGKLQSTLLQIKYNENPGKYGAVDEYRPFSFLDAPIEKLWPLADNKSPIAYQERIRPAEEVRAASWIKAVYSDWQLREIMVEFWHNHFNVNAFSDQKIAATFPIYDREVIRRNCFGNFRAFLEDVSKSTAMLYFLDNFTSKASPANENYARELFELHTLGSDFYFNNLYNRWKVVPGALQEKPIGYIDEDVYEAARAFTGWTVANGANAGKGDSLPDTGNFYYFDGWHDNYQKRVLAYDFPPNQPPLQDGLKVLDLVANHPATAKHICKKLCKRFVSDTPSDQLVNSAAKVWTLHQNSNDQIAKTLQHIFESLDFLNSLGKKVKRPFDLMVSMFRATSADFTPNNSLTGQLAQMGYFHYQWPSPTGHPDNKEYWISSNSLLARWNIASALLTSQNNKVASYHLASLMPENTDTPQKIVTYWVQRILQKNKPAEFLKKLTDYLAPGMDVNAPFSPGNLDSKLNGLFALLAMTPDFQYK